MSPEAADALGPYTPTLILHGGAGAIARAHLPPALYARYAASLSEYAVSTSALLRGGADAVEAACHAVCRMEDDALFNCGRGSVFTEAGAIEMEASVMVCSVDSAWEGEGSVKRGAAVSMITETRHPVLLAREVLRQGEDGWAELGAMHCQRSGRAVEEWGWGLGGGRGLERKARDWFWTRRRWEEHLRDLEGRGIEVKREALGDDVDVDVHVDVDDAAAATDEHANNHLGDQDGVPLPSQGTVGCVCMDSWGTLAVATSTGGLTNKKPGRIGDTPTLGAGFWAESWDEEIPRPVTIPVPSSLPSTHYGLSGMGPLDLAAEELGNVLAACFPSFSRATRPVPRNKPMLLPTTETSSPPCTSPARPSASPHKPSRSPPRSRTSRRAVAMSGTGNGDSFLRTSAARTAAAMARFSPTSLGQAISNIAGYDGELQQSAGERWGQTGEGEGGIIGIEAVGGSTNGHLVAEFNCSGMWRAWVDEKTGSPRVMVFREEYQ